MKYKIKEVTPKEITCIVGSCPSIYEATREGEEVYLVIGRVIKPSEVELGELEKKIGEGEILIEVPKVLIDNREK